MLSSMRNGKGKSLKECWNKPASSTDLRKRRKENCQWYKFYQTICIKRIRLLDYPCPGALVLCKNVSMSFETESYNPDVNLHWNVFILSKHTHENMFSAISMQSIHQISTSWGSLSLQKWLPDCLLHSLNLQIAVSLQIHFYQVAPWKWQHMAKPMALWPNFKAVLVLKIKDSHAIPIYIPPGYLLVF